MTTSSLAPGLDPDQLLAVLNAMKNGDFSARLPTGASGTAGEIAATVNALQDQLCVFSSETNRLTREIGQEGRFGGQAVLPELSGEWKEMAENLNLMARNLTNIFRDIASVTTYIANGDLAKKVTVKTHGEIRELTDTINLMVDQLNSFASEITRISRELGTEGKFGGQAEVKGVAGSWQHLVDNVNFMAANLTIQVRTIAQVVHNVAKGDLTTQINLKVRGEMLELTNMINTMITQVNLLSDEFRRIANEIGTEGKFGGQAEVAGLGGTWQDLVTDVNRMSANLTAQIRDLSRTATALVAGDTTRRVTAVAAGETVELKDAVNRLVDQHSQSRR